MIIPHITIVGIYRSPTLSLAEMCSALQDSLQSLQTEFNIFIGDFNVNWLNPSQCTPLQNLFLKDNGYRQLVSCCTTDDNTCIDHLYTNMPEAQIRFQIFETYFSDHKAICALINCFDVN